jgi:hypothetical protein
MSDSLRHQILQEMLATFTAVTPSSPPDDDGYPFQFSLVELGALGDADHRKRYSLGIVPGAERYAYSYPFIERFLTVGIEMRVTVNRDDDKPGHLAERLLFVVERVVMQNCTWGGLAIDTNFKNNELGMQSYVDKTVDGVLWIEIHYRHQQGDPRDPDPSL